MKESSSIFLATDYSEQVSSAERYAFEFAKETNSLITVIHVFDLPFNMPSDANAYVKETERVRKFEMQKLKLHCEVIMHSLGIKVNEVNWECLVLEGSIAKEISKEVESSQPDLIVIGTHKTKGSISFFENSHSWEIINKTNIPILSVPKDYLIKEINKIVFATEFREGEISGLKYLVDFARKFNSEVIALHINNQSSSSELEKINFQEFKTDILDYINYDKLSFQVIHADNIVGGINDYCITNQVDWLAMAHSKPALLKRLFQSKKSVTKEMILHCEIPLLSLPDYFPGNKKEIDSTYKSTLFKDNVND